ncbi:spoIVB peptidase S55 family protein [Dialister sp. CAG:588]|nr:spoIVB peptidase S55 family protein [Dialister sp. CAG:588]
MKNFQMVPYAAASSSEDTTAMPLVPGSSVAATMVTGDLKLGAIGTVTYVDDDHILAFGHPFMSKGNTDYFMHNSYIFTVIPSTYSPFKLGSIGAEIGTINQDRGAGIVGISGRIPSFIPLHTTVFDEDLHSRKDLNVRMINNEKLLPTLTATSVYNAISNTIDREGEGTVSLTYSLYPKDIKKKPFKKSNMYWSTKDISSRSVDEIYNVLDILSENRFEKYDIRQIQVDMSVTKERKTAQILDATATPMIVSPGDTIYIKARLQAYRGDIFYKELTFRVPDDQPYGKMILEIRGGGVTPLPYLIEQQKYNLSDEILDRLRVYKDFDHLQKVLLNENQNNQIVVEILDPNVSMIAKDETSGSSTEIQGKKIITKPEYLHEREKKTQQNEDKNSSKSYVNTDYVIYGDGQFSFTVLPPDKREEALKQMVKKQKELIAEMYREQQSSDLINEEKSSD